MIKADVTLKVIENFFPECADAEFPSFGKLMSAFIFAFFLWPALRNDVKLLKQSPTSG